MAKFIDLNQIKEKNDYLISKVEDKERSKIYHKIYQEINKKKFDPEIYVKSLQSCKGNPQEAVAEYISQRFDQLFKHAEDKTIRPYRNRLVQEYERAVDKLKFKKK